MGGTLDHDLFDYLGTPLEREMPRDDVERIIWLTNRASECHAELKRLTEKSPSVQTRKRALRKLVNLGVQLCETIELIRKGNEDHARSVAVTLDSWPFALDHRPKLGVSVEAIVDVLGLGSCSEFPHEVSLSHKWSGFSKNVALQLLEVIHAAKIFHGHDKNVLEARQSIASHDSRTKENLRERLRVYRAVRREVRSRLQTQLKSICELIACPHSYDKAETQRNLARRYAPLPPFSKHSMVQWIESSIQLLDMLTGGSLQQNETLLDNIVRGEARRKRGGLRGAIVQEISRRIANLVPTDPAKMARAALLYDPQQRRFHPSEPD